MGSYLWIGMLGAVAGWLAGYFVTGSRQGLVIDVISGAVGAWLAVVLSRVVAPEIAAGFVVSVIVAVTGAILTLFAMNRFMGASLMNAPRSHRRT